MFTIRLAIAATVSAFATASPANTPVQSMSFFITSVGPGDGANLSGLAGADRHCQRLAEAAGVTGKTWHAYLGQQAQGNLKAINARDRIGKGPWHNAEGRLIARNVAELHGLNNINRTFALTEKGTKVNGRAESPNTHDILTGSQPDGTAMAGDAAKTTCGNWTMSGEGAAMVGHHDRWGLRDDAPSISWNSSHPSRGCSQANLVSSGGAGLVYCFATN